jgi:hypothetical protein
MQEQLQTRSTLIAESKDVTLSVQRILPGREARQLVQAFETQAKVSRPGPQEHAGLRPNA